MREADADTRAETPSRTQTAGRGTAGGSSTARQTRPAREDTGGNEALTLIEQVVRRENLVAAHAIYRDEAQLIQSGQQAAEELTALFEADQPPAETTETTG